ncbi:iron-siderophore ABC transporter substrate-binding protein [Vibrio sp.]|uniref:iron-siderophore ABC transporter substrate-binding protein n=1 Tax=Vibrio sp. TaxID=678 RepID=UPI00311D7051
MTRVSIFLTIFFALSVRALEIHHDYGTESFERIPEKVITLDWTLAETLISLGIQPQGIADVSGYNTWVSQPKLGPNIVDVGKRREPNIVRIAELKPDVILISGYMASSYHELTKIAPVLVYSVYNTEKEPLLSAMSITRSLGSLFGKQSNAEKIIQQTEEHLKENADKIKMKNIQVKPLLFVRLMNEGTLRIHSQGSLVQAVIDKMNLKNDWHEETNIWGFTTTGVEKIANHQQANVLIFGPLMDDERELLSKSPLWQEMRFTQTNSVYELPVIWSFGSLISAQRLSDSITELLISR